MGIHGSPVVKFSSERKRLFLNKSQLLKGEKSTGCRGGGKRRQRGVQEQKQTLAHLFHTKKQNHLEQCHIGDAPLLRKTRRIEGFWDRRERGRRATSGRWVSVWSALFSDLRGEGRLEWRSQRQVAWGDSLLVAEDAVTSRVWKPKGGKNIISKRREARAPDKGRTRLSKSDTLRGRSSTP